jgi:hypothetical protein
MLGPAGAGGGFSLAEKAETLTKLFASSAALLGTFKAGLEACGYHDADSKHYNRKFAMRRPLGVIPVDDRFPAITRDVIREALGKLSSRIESLQYDANLEGLELEEGKPGFTAILPV